MENSDKDREQLLRLLNGDLSERELSELSDDEDFRKYQDILSEVDSWTLPALDITASYDKLRNRRTPVRTLTWYQTNVFKIAATLLIMAVAAVFFLTSDSIMTYETQMAQTEEITLPDRSIVNLGPSSLLSYDEDKWGDVRELNLKGTAYFSVTKGTPFKVHFNSGTVEVTGTAFEIRTFEGYAAVMCYEGSVNVRTGNEVTPLVRGQLLKIPSQGEPETDTFAYKNWSKDLIRFQSTPLYVVFGALESQFGIKINAGSVDKNRVYNGSFTTENVDLALKMVCEPMNINYDKNGNSVTLQ